MILRDIVRLMHQRLGHLVQDIAREQEAGNAQEDAVEEMRQEAHDIACMLNAWADRHNDRRGYVDVYEMLYHEAQRY